MNFVWHHNPLKTQIVLTENEKLLFKSKLLIEDLKESIGFAAFHLEEGKYFNIEKALLKCKG